MVHKGTYPTNFEDPQLAGKPYVAITNFQDKSNKLSVHNSYLRDTSDVMRFLVDYEDPANFGSSLLRLIAKHSPGQVRMYCSVASTSRRATLARSGHPNAFFIPNKPMGYKKIGNLIKKLGQKVLGLPPTFRPHSLRSAMITMLANDPSVSTKETMKAARHSSVSATNAYICLLYTSDAADE